MKVEVGSGGGAFRFITDYVGDGYETENVEFDDYVKRIDADDLKVEFYVDDSATAPGYDIIRWNGPSGDEEFYIQENDDAVDAYLDGELITASGGTTLTI